MEKIKDLIVKHVWSRPLRHRPEDSFILRIVRNFCQFILLISLFVLIYAFIVTLGWIKGAAMSLISVACSAVYWLTTSYLGRLSSGWIKKPMLAKAFAYGVRAAVSLALIFWLFDFFLQSGAVGNMTNTRGKHDKYDALQLCDNLSQHIRDFLFQPVRLLYYSSFASKKV